MKVNKPKLSLDLKTLVALYRGGFAFFGMTLNGIVGWSLLKLSLGKSKNFNYQYVSAFFCRIILFGLGMRVIFPSKKEFSHDKMLYIFNHNSYLDIFIIPAMRIPNCRYLINEVTKSILPLYLGNLANGAIFVPHPKKDFLRKKFFQETAFQFKNDKYSIFASPEGVHTFKHSISPFNIGVFEMALKAKVDICPLFFNVSKESNPLESYFFKAGKVTIEKLPIISTKGWTEENLKDKVNEIEKIYKNKFISVHGEMDG